MNVQAFFQQTSSRVLYTMTSKAHGYGVEEAITSSEGSGGGDDGAYTTHWMSVARRRRRRRLSCQIPHEWNCCQQLPNASLSFSSSLWLRSFAWLCWLRTSSIVSWVLLRKDKFKQIGKQIQVSSYRRRWRRRWRRRQFMTAIVKEGLMCCWKVDKADRLSSVTTATGQRRRILTTRSTLWPEHVSILSQVHLFFFPCTVVRGYDVNFWSSANLSTNHNTVLQSSLPSCPQLKDISSKFPSYRRMTVCR